MRVNTNAPKNYVELLEFFITAISTTPRRLRSRMAWRVGRATFDRVRRWKDEDSRYAVSFGLTNPESSTLLGLPVIHVEDEERLELIAGSFDEMRELRVRAWTRIDFREGRFYFFSREDLVSWMEQTGICAIREVPTNHTEPFL